jgi:hypothetical protein
MTEIDTVAAYRDLREQITALASGLDGAAAVVD